MVGADPSIFVSRHSVFMNRILVAAHHTPSPIVATQAVPSPVLRGAAGSVVLETCDYHGESMTTSVRLPHTLSASIVSLRVMSMDVPSIIVMETADD
jgi:hypothetical protein